MVNLSKLSMALPKYPTDKIIGVFTGTLHVAAPTGAQQVLYAETSLPTGFGDSCLTQCIYSYDNGVTWNDDNMSVPNYSGAFPVIQTLDVTSFSDPNTVGIAVANWYNAVSGSGTAYTILFKIFALAKTGQGDITPLPTKYPLSYSSKDNYLKIFASGKVPLAIPGSNVLFVYAVAHGLGYIPASRGYVEYVSTGRIWPATSNQYPNTGSGSVNNPVGTDIQMTTASTSYNFFSSIPTTDNINLYYVVYYNA